MTPFVAQGSIVRQIWGTADTVLFIFAGAAAEFALNKAVDWLYYTGRLPSDPLGRLFSTVDYARLIVFSDTEGAHRAIDKMASIHAGVEASRGMRIPDWAYRDVLFMLIHYSISSFEALERKLTQAEKAEVFDVFYRVGARMGVQGLPVSFPAWEEMRAQHLAENLVRSHFTEDLFRQYQKHLGTLRYRLLLEAQLLVVPAQVRQLLQTRHASLLSPLLGLYRVSRVAGLDKLLKWLLLPSAYKSRIKALDNPGS